ncbi:MAG: hypothetical protein ACLRWF_02720 [Ruthenibacterium sp.]
MGHRAHHSCAGGLLGPFCAVMSYATVFLLSLGYSSAPRAPSLPRATWRAFCFSRLRRSCPRAGSARAVVLGMALALAALAGALCLVNGQAPVCAALIVLMYGLLYTMQGC